MTDDTIKDRIRKLLAVANNDASTDGEIDNALRFARNLMDRHHLSEEDLVVAPQVQWKDIAQATCGHYHGHVGTKTHHWEVDLAHFICAFVGGVKFYCNNAWRTHRTVAGLAICDDRGEPLVGKSMVFYGLDEDAALSAELYHELRITIIAMGRLKYGGCFRGDGGMYCEGFVIGLRSRLVEQRTQERINQDAGSRALILAARRQDLIIRKCERANEYLQDTLQIKLRASRGRGGANGSGAAHREGRADGARADVTAARRPKLPR